LRKTIIIAALLALVAGAATVYARNDGAEHAHADIEGVGGSTLEGIARFVEDANGKVHVIVRLENAPPGLHGTHVHAIGDCGNNGLSAGPHYDPDGSASHGNPSDPVGSHHAGDLYNTQVNVAENGHGTTMTLAFTLSTGIRSVIARSIIIHANQDNYTNTPVNGGSAGRIGCGVIEED